MLLGIFHHQKQYNTRKIICQHTEPSPVFVTQEKLFVNTQNRPLCSLIKELSSLGSFSGVDKNGNDVYNGDVKKERIAHIVIGLPAAGKSSVLVNPLSESYAARVVDCDMAKAMLPEYDGGIGANAVHLESKDISDEVLKNSLQNGENIVYPIVGASYNKLLGTIASIKDKGYTVYLHLNELPNGKAIGRALMRYFQTGRFISPDLIKECGNKPTAVFEKIIQTEGLIDGYTRFSNDVEKGKEPIRRAKRGNIKEFDGRISKLGSGNTGDGSLCG